MSIYNDDELLEELKSRFNQQRKSLKELEYLTGKLKELNHKLEESEKLKSHFLSNIRNEIINPFASIIGLSQSIKNIPAEKIEKIHSMSTMIHSEAFALDFQLRNIFSAAEIEAGDLTLQYAILDVNDLCNSIISSFKHEVEKKDLKVNFSSNTSEVPLKTDPDKLKVIISNIFSNAIKYSNKGADIDFTIHSDGAFVVIEIKDYGIGIEEKSQKLIFDRFKRIDDTINSLNIGHGLGLSVVQAYLDLIGGSIDLSSEVNKGSTFAINIVNFENVDGEYLGDDDIMFESGGEMF